MSKSKSTWNKESIMLNGENNVNYSKIFNQFSLMAKNRFLWTNLPKGVESRHIENFLFSSGQVGFVEDSDLGFLCLPCNQTGTQNVYGDPLGYTLTGQGFSKQYKSDDVVRILSNDNLYPDILTISYYADMIDELEKTMFINLRQQRLPYIVSTSKNNELTMKNMLKKINDGENAIFVDEKFSQGGNVGVNVLKTDNAFLLDKLQSHKNDIMNELYTFLGLNSKSTDKKERLLVDEINVNNSQILINLDIAFKNRLKACELINEKYNLNIKVEKTIDNLTVDFLGGLKDVQ